MSEWFDAYYYPLDRDAAGCPILRGAAKLHYIEVYPQCFLIRQDAAYLPLDLRGEAMADYPLAEADPDRMGNVLAYVSGADPSGLFHPATVARCLALESQGMGREQIVETIGALMIPEYVGSTPDEVMMVHPEWFEVRVVDVDGQSIEVVDFSFGQFA